MACGSGCQSCLPRGCRRSVGAVLGAHDDDLAPPTGRGRGDVGREGVCPPSWETTAMAVHPDRRPVVDGPEVQQHALARPRGHVDPSPVPDDGWKTVSPMPLAGDSNGNGTSMVRSKPSPRPVPLLGDARRSRRRTRTPTSRRGRPSRAGSAAGGSAPPGRGGRPARRSSTGRSWWWGLPCRQSAKDGSRTPAHSEAKVSGACRPLRECTTSSTSARSPRPTTTTRSDSPARAASSRNSSSPDVKTS